jgi:hypothetical protein
MQKQIWEITKIDIENYPAWVFPMSEEGGSDEATVVPACDRDLSNPNSQVIVECEVIDSKGGKYTGYMYWAVPVCIEHCQPLIWVEGRAVGFWFGIHKPDITELPNLSFPLISKTKEIGELKSIELEINGYGYINGKANAVIS